jgi:uncharacterized protein YndB with AHSA1/START domain
MESTTKTTITVKVEINAPIEKVWELWTTPAHIMQWNNTSSEWQNLKVENDPRPGGRFLFVMASKDGSQKFDFTGTYDEVITNELISYTLDDGRKTINTFSSGNPLEIIEAFDAEGSLPVDMQRDFCNGVLLSFKNYAENNWL